MFINFFKNFIFLLFLFFIFFIFLTKYRKNIMKDIYILLKNIWPIKNKGTKKKQQNIIFNKEFTRVNNTITINKNNLLTQLNNIFHTSRNSVNKYKNTSFQQNNLYQKYYKQYLRQSLDVNYLTNNLRQPIYDIYIRLPDNKQRLTNIQIEKTLLLLNFLYKQKKYPKEKNLIINILQNN
jgi:hypothetical protein